MNTKINSDISSSRFINKVAFYLTLFTIIAGVIFQIFIIKDKFFIFNLPYITAGNLSEINFLTDGNIFDYFSYSASIVISIILFYFLIPFNLIFSVSTAVPIFKEKFLIKKYIRYEIFNFLISVITIVLILASSIYFNYFFIPSKSETSKLTEQIEQIKLENTINNLAYEIRNIMSVPKKNKGWFGMEQKEIELYKQYNANFITSFLNDTTNKYLSKATPILIDFYKLDLKVKTANNSFYKLSITPLNQSFEVTD
ncbi:MAG TPA: hypothetical protein PL041_07150 [Melioribacteraceae bacterium]|nr:hypothetical protein [Melioribacteraceae bacterium]